MLFIPIIIGFLLLVSTIQTLLYPTEQNKVQQPQLPPHYNYGAENPYFRQPFPYSFLHPNAFQKKAPSEEELLQIKKRQDKQSILYTFLFVMGLLAFLIYN